MSDAAGNWRCNDGPRKIGLGLFELRLCALQLRLQHRNLFFGCDRVGLRRRVGSVWS